MKNIIFDWSGVVRDAVTNQLWIVNKIFYEYKVPTISLEEFKENWKQPYIRFYEKYLPSGFSEEERAGLYNKFLFDKDCPKAASVDLMPELIKKLKEKGHSLFVVSSDLKESLLPEIQEYGLEGIFDRVFTDTDNKLKTVQNLVNEKYLNKENTFFVGDSNHEIQVSKETGIKSVAVTWGFTSENKLRAGEPDYVANNPVELEEIIL